MPADNCWKRIIFNITMINHFQLIVAPLWKQLEKKTLIYYFISTLFSSEQDPSLGTPPPVDSTGESGAQWGPPVPPTSNLEDICPPATTCPACARCSDPALSLADLLDHLRVEPLGGKQYKGLPARTTGSALNPLIKSAPYYHYNLNTH